MAVPCDPWRCVEGRGARVVEGAGSVSSGPTCLLWKAVQGVWEGGETSPIPPRVCVMGHCGHDTPITGGGGLSIKG